MKRSLIYLVVLVLLVAGLWYVGTGRHFGRNASQYQAVFLTNGQVYFGKFREGMGGPTLSDIYYLRVQQPIQPAETESKPDVQLVKLGNEVHGPKDAMRLNRDQILFVEDLKDDGKVVTAIREYQAGAKDGE